MFYIYDTVNGRFEAHDTLEKAQLALQEYIEEGIQMQSDYYETMQEDRTLQQIREEVEAFYGIDEDWS